MGADVTRARQAAAQGARKAAQGAAVTAAIVIGATVTGHHTVPGDPLPSLPVTAPCKFGADPGTSGLPWCPGLSPTGSAP